ncbi:zf-HC2 domain-containing protein [Candidatus Poribacteria bacterium]|nr:zf-HC2 domain-containing protein [Candidatus Poribacteria bacterium]
MNLNCHKIHDRLVHFLNGELPPSEYIFWENHLSECTVCQIEYEKLTDTIVALRHLPQPEPPADLVLKIRRRLEEQQRRFSEAEVASKAKQSRLNEMNHKTKSLVSEANTAPNTPIFDLITLIFAKIVDALKLGPRPVYINYAALFCYLMLAIFLIKLTFLTGSGSSPQTVAPNQSNNYMAVNSVAKNKSGRNDITWAQVKMAGVRTSLDLANNRELSEKPQILRPIGSQVLHGGSWYEFR